MFKLTQHLSIRVNYCTVDKHAMGMYKKLSDTSHQLLTISATIYLIKKLSGWPTSKASPALRENVHRQLLSDHIRPTALSWQISNFQGITHSLLFKIALGGSEGL